MSFRYSDYEPYDSVASRYGSRRVQFTGPLGQTGYSDPFHRGVVYWVDVERMTIEEFEIWCSSYLRHEVNHGNSH